MILRSRFQHKLTMDSVYELDNLHSQYSHFTLFQLNASFFADLNPLINSCLIVFQGTMAMKRTVQDERSLLTSKEVPGESIYQLIDREDQVGPAIAALGSETMLAFDCEGSILGGTDHLHFCRYQPETRRAVCLTSRYIRMKQEEKPNHACKCFK